MRNTESENKLGSVRRPLPETVMAMDSHTIMTMDSCTHLCVTWRLNNWEII